jgi:hypothetical protein
MPCWEWLARVGDSNKPRFVLIKQRRGTTIKSVHFVVHNILPVFQYLFLAGLIGAIPVIIVTAIRTAESMFEGDEPVRDHKV